MAEELNYEKEIAPLIEEKTEVEKKEDFLKEYRELVMKHGYDFMQQQPIIVKVNFVNPNEQPK